MPRLIGGRGARGDGWQWLVVEDEKGHRRPRPWLIIPLLAVVAAIVLAAGLALRSAGDTSAASPVPGAIFTTEADGVPVNANLYGNKHKVHLNGGPPENAPPGAAGLNDGDYYFQVTDPSGAVLLSSDPLKCRRIRVDDGVITGSVNLDGTLNNSSVGFGSRSEDCPHHVHDDDTKAPVDARTVHLMPYDDTPNPGGVYKVWATPVDDLLCAEDPNTITTCEVGRFHGFDPAHSKTDNFKVKGDGSVRKGSISGLKWYDANDDGVLDGAEDTIPGWPIKICNVGPITQTKGKNYNIPNIGDCTTLFTDGNGAYTLIDLRGSSYCVREARARDMDTDAADPEFNSFDWEQTFPTSPATSLVFGDGCDSSGTFDRDLMNGVHVITLAAGESAIDVDFGNVAFELVRVAGGLTWGYWKTHTGTGDTPPNAPIDPVYESPLGIDLGSTVGTHLDVETPEDADTVFAADGSGTNDEPPWPSPQEISDLCSEADDCRNGDFAHPADCEGDCHELLTAQLLALKLNILSGEFSGDAIYINPDDPFSGMTVTEIIAIADGALTAWFSGGALDFHMLLATIDTINNNATSEVLFSAVPLASPPSPLCFVGFACA